MKTRDYKKIWVSKKGEDSINKNHPWIYKGDIVKEDDSIKNGEIVDVTNDKDKYLGSGLYNSNSKITVRLISRNANDKFDEDFFRRRISFAIDYRINVMNNELNAFRVIYGESDEMPGLTVDKFNDILVVQILSLGLEVRKDLILNLLYEKMNKRELTINGIYIRNDVDIREKEGLEMYKGWYEKIPHPKNTFTYITENGIKYKVDFENGQKTGFFLDQKVNRMLIRNIAKGKRVLDCCTHTGSFAMNAYIAGAREVIAMDISEKALEDASENFKLNNMNIKTVCEDVFEFLPKMEDFDFIILDPPAFTKSRKTIEKALKGYEEINYLAMKKVKRGGFLATASCSHFASPDLFLNAIYKASLKANVKLKEVSYTGPSPDHPKLIGVDETEYLKFFIFEVI